MSGLNKLVSLIGFATAVVGYTTTKPAHTTGYTKNHYGTTINNYGTTKKDTNNYGTTKDARPFTPATTYFYHVPIPTITDSNYYATQEHCYCESNGKHIRRRLGERRLSITTTNKPNNNYYTATNKPNNYYTTTQKHDYNPYYTTGKGHDTKYTTKNQYSYYYYNVTKGYKSEGDSDEDDNEGNSNNEDSDSYVLVDGIYFKEESSDDGTAGDDSSDEGTGTNCHCQPNTTPKPVPPCWDGFAAGSACLWDTDCYPDEYCDVGIGGFCCYEGNPWAGVNDLKEKTFSEKIAYYYTEKTGMFITIIVGLSIAIIGLLLGVICLMKKLHNKNKYARVETTNEGAKNPEIDITRVSVSKQAINDIDSDDDDDTEQDNDQDNETNDVKDDITNNDDSALPVVSQDTPNTPSDRNV